MKEKTKRIISMLLGVTASIISFYYIQSIVTTLLQAFIAVAFAAMGVNLVDITMTIATGISFFALGLLIFYNSVTLTKSNYQKKSRRLIFIGLFFLTYSLYHFIYMYFKLGWDPAFPSLGVSVIGILTIISGYLGTSTSESKMESSYLNDRKKFSKRIKILSLLILLFLSVTIIFNINKINKLDFRGDIGNLELDGKIVFAEGNTRGPQNKICLVDLKYPKEIDCFGENGRKPFWGPDGKNIFYYKWDGEGHIDTVIYNTIDGTKEMLSGEDAYEENKELRELEIKERPRNIMISPDGKRSVYSSASSIYLLDEENLGKKPTILLESGHYENENYFGYPRWYSNNQILFQGKLMSNKIFSERDKKYNRGFFLMNDDGSNIKLVVPNNGDYWLHYESPDLYLEIQYIEETQDFDSETKETNSEETGWRTCSIPRDISKTINSFDCPIWMQSIDWDKTYQDDIMAKFCFYNFLDQKTQRAYLYKKTGIIAFIVENIESDDSGNYKGFNKIKFLYPNHKVATLYTNSINIYHEELSDIKFSPDGKYISFILHVYEGQHNIILDINTGKNILTNYDIFCGLNDIIWSSNSKYIAINNHINFMGGEGSESIFVGDVTKGSRLIKVFEVDYQDAFHGKKIDKLNFDKDDKNIYFSVISSIEDSIDEVKYKYNISNNEILGEI
jgi:hypothetical protein